MLDSPASSSMFPMESCRVWRRSTSTVWLIHLWGIHRQQFEWLYSVLAAQLHSHQQAAFSRVIVPLRYVNIQFVPIWSWIHRKYRWIHKCSHDLSDRDRAQGSIPQDTGSVAYLPLLPIIFVDTQLSDVSLLTMLSGMTSVSFPQMNSLYLNSTPLVLRSNH